MEKIKRYVVQFAGVYILCNILVAAITYFFISNLKKL